MSGDPLVVGARANTAEQVDHARTDAGAAVGPVVQAPPPMGKILELQNYRMQEICN
jgi:hypothetical protein